MKSHHKRFSPWLLVVIVAFVLAAGAGLFVIIQRDGSDSGSIDPVAKVGADTTANGTPENTVKAVEEQVSTEITAEDAAMDLEEEATKLDSSIVDELQGVADEANL
jgi:hypothetical protein